MLQADTDVTTTARRDNYWRTRPQWASLIDDPKDPILSSISYWKCAYADFEAFLRRYADAETTYLQNGKPMCDLPKAWEEVRDMLSEGVTDACKDFVSTVPTTKRGVFEALNFWNREANLDLFTSEQKHQFMHSLESALLSLNG